MYRYITRRYSYVTHICSYVIRISLAFGRISSVCHSYVPVYHWQVLACHSYVLVCHLYFTRMSSVCHLYVLVSHAHITRMYSYVICMSFVCVFTMNLFNRLDKTSLALVYKDKYKRVDITLFKKQTDSQNCLHEKFRTSIFAIKSIAISQAQRMKRMRLTYTKSMYKFF